MDKKEMVKSVEIGSKIMEVVEASKQGISNSDIQALAQAKAIEIIREKENYEIRD